MDQTGREWGGGGGCSLQFLDDSSGGRVRVCGSYRWIGQGTVLTTHLKAGMQTESKLWNAVFPKTYLEAGCGSYRQRGMTGCSLSNSTAETDECRYLPPTLNRTGTGRCVENKQHKLAGCA